MWTLGMPGVFARRVERLIAKNERGRISVYEAVK